ncbi:MAG: tyrosine-type recombinase/integrase [Alphaproteobacteria bacterium]|nr:tyrosine-type recombinase/integrase [Alphaproteobacteria bacterium]
MKLNEKICRNAKPKDKPYKLFDGEGLYLLVQPTGGKLWRMKYRFQGKEKVLAFGSYPLLPLAEARERKYQARKLLNAAPPIDPMQARQDQYEDSVRQTQNSFKAVALEWHEVQKERWSTGYADKNLRILEMNIFPHVGDRPIAQLTPPEVLKCLRQVENRQALDIAAKTRQIFSMVFRYGIQTGKCEHDAAADLRGALKTRKTQHYATLDAKTLPAFLHALERNEARLYERTRRAIWFSLLTFQRPGEIRQAQWSEIDWEAKEWHISAEKMKMRRPHIVPLSHQALRILEEQREETGHLNTDWIFPSQVKPRQPMSDGTVNHGIKRLGFGEQMVAHGFRALARTLIREKIGTDSEVIEKQLAHKTSSPLGEAYDRTEFLPDRKKMMQQWADYLDALASGGKVIRAKFGVK